MRMLRETLRRRIGWTHTGTAALILLAATFGFEPSDIPANPVPTSISDNAMTFNAMTFNALIMHPNEELADYSLTQVVAPGSVFEQGLDMDPYAREFMEYLVSCALPEGDDLTWVGGNQTWDGALGLCPSWKNSAPDQECQELVSACLLARTNAYGQSVSISVRGLYTDDTPMPLGPNEDVDYPWQEGAFFGNAFCQDCVDPSLDMFVLNGLLHYRVTSLTSPPQTTEVTCDSFEGLPEREVRRLRNECHWRFLQTTGYEGVVYRAMFACWSPVWEDGKAYTLARICAGAASNGGVVQDQKQCAAWPVGACTAASLMVPCQTKDICDVADSAPQPKDWDVDECAAMPMSTNELPAPGVCPAAPPLTSPTWHHPVTVFLDEPCAIVPEREGCRLNPAIIDPFTGGPRMPIEETTEPR
jgi:hypothetical protein